MSLVTGMLAKILLIALAIAAAAGLVQAKPNVPFRVTSEPSGATVKLTKDDGKVIATGITPWDTTLPDHWAHPGIAKRLNYPVQIVVSEEGYVTRNYTITDLHQEVVNGGDVVGWYALRGESWDVNLYRAVEFVGNPNGRASSSPEPTFPSVESIQAAAAVAKPALVLIHAGSAYGTGFFITDNGVIVTSRGLIGASTAVTIITDSGKTLKSESISVSPDRDIALIKVPGSGYHHLRLASMATITEGEPILAVGSALMPVSGRGIAGGMVMHVPDPPGVVAATLGSPTIALGEVRRVGRTVNNGWLLQTDASIYWGNTGGPLLNLSGEVVGVNSTDIVALITPKDGSKSDEPCLRCVFNRPETRSAKSAAGADMPILREMDTSANDLSFVDTGGSPFEPDDAHQVVNRTRGVAIASGEIIELLKARFSPAP